MRAAHRRARGDDIPVADEFLDVEAEVVKCSPRRSPKSSSEAAFCHRITPSRSRTCSGELMARRSTATGAAAASTFELLLGTPPDQGSHVRQKLGPASRLDARRIAPTWLMMLRV